MRKIATIFLSLTVCVGIFTLLPQSAAAADQEEDLDKTFQPGLVATYHDGKTTCQRLDRTIAFDWSGSSPDKRLSLSPFSVTWRGFLFTQGRGQFQLRVFAAGQVRVQLAEQIIIDGSTTGPTWLSAPSQELSYGWHPFEVQFTQTSNSPQIRLFWSGPQFQLEPISTRYLFHDVTLTPDDSFERGAALVRALRCATCHEFEIESDRLTAPSLNKLPGNLNPQWLLDYLSAAKTDQDTNHQTLSRRMPWFQFDRGQAAAISAYLLSIRQSKLIPAGNSNVLNSKSNDPSKSPKTEAELIAAGERLFLSLGCLACHKMGSIGESSLFDGGELTDIAMKRPNDFYARWLAHPEAVNEQHRMPNFSLGDEDVEALAEYLSDQGSEQTIEQAAKTPASDKVSQIELGRQLINTYRCASCHLLPDPLDASIKIPLSIGSDWSKSCCVDTQPASQHQPSYLLSDQESHSIRNYIAGIALPASPDIQSRQALTGDQLLIEHNCLGCHARDGSLGIASKFGNVGTIFPNLAAQLPAMTPPALTSVGDKLNDQTLQTSIDRSAGVHRPYLQVRMPKFNLPPDSMQAIIDTFISNDRIPAGAEPRAEIYQPEAIDSGEASAIRLAGERLVTTDGFGCTSCHQVGSVEPPAAPLNARGPNLSMLGERIRLSWFDRWVHDPSRIIPRMEMPSVQIPVPGVLEDKLDRQLSAVWRTLNRPGFEPPLPNPIRVVRRSGVTARHEPSVVLTDAIRHDEHVLVKPLVIGLPNRQNVLLDLETNQLAAWWIGDVARQRTDGKRWYWETAGHNMLKELRNLTDFQLAESQLNSASESHWLHPQMRGQFMTEFDSYEQTEQGVSLKQRLQFKRQENESLTTIVVTQSFVPLLDASGFRRHIVVTGIPRDWLLRVNVAEFDSRDPKKNPPATIDSQYPQSVQLRAETPIEFRLNSTASARWHVDATSVALVSPATNEGISEVSIDYITTVIPDQFPFIPLAPSPMKSIALNVVPGFEATQLPISQEVMPTALAWQADGSLLISSLKGSIWLARDTDGDSLEDSLRLFCDGLAAPYGLAAGPGYVDVINKYALLRMIDANDDDQADHVEMLASGWGHTNDYHDWVVGLPRDELGNYYLGLPCQQDERSPVAAKYRGQVLRLKPREPTPDDPSRYSIETISMGHRFPMGLARNQVGNLFVTDNQGNYNPFNELNHVLPGRHFGFINASERGNSNVQPKLTPPAIDIPHPWTRSVNGICFLETPPSLLKHSSEPHFGPFEGHLIGCEYDSRRLIRMTVQKVGDTVQGAAYPFSYDPSPDSAALQGPLVCAVAPDGDLYVGSIRDSGWGGGNNIGSLVRCCPDLSNLPAGIREIRLAEGKLVLEFTAAVDETLVAQMKNYSVQSYTRVSTPAYGGSDVDRRRETIRSVIPSLDNRRVTIDVGELRADFVYEINVQPLVAKPAEFFPAEAYYTVRVIE